MPDKKETEKTCFIITPIGKPDSEIRRHINGINDAAIKPVLHDELGYTVSVAHEIASPGSIPKQVVLEIKNSDIVIANLTGNNPNVMYEVALRHCFGTPMIMIADETTEIPSDITSERTIYYRNDAAGVLELKEKLSETMREIHDKGEITQTGPVYDILRSESLEAKVLSEVSADGQENIYSLMFKKLDEIQSSINTQKAGPQQAQQQVFQEKKMPMCICHIKAQTTVEDKDELEKIAQAILSKQSAPTQIIRQIEEIGDDYIKIMAKGPRFFIGPILENSVRNTFKEFGIDEVTISRELEEMPVV